jgi:thioredoxin-like negative regulator of GroEL
VVTVSCLFWLTVALLAPTPPAPKEGEALVEGASDTSRSAPHPAILLNRVLQSGDASNADRLSAARQLVERHVSTPQAAEAFLRVMSTTRDRPEEQRSLVERFVKFHPGHPSAFSAMLFLARKGVEAGDLDSARKWMQSAGDHPELGANAQKYARSAWAFSKQGLSQESCESWIRSAIAAADREHRARNGDAAWTQDINVRVTLALFLYATNRVRQAKSVLGEIVARAKTEPLGPRRNRCENVADTLMSLDKRR